MQNQWIKMQQTWKWELSFDVNLLLFSEVLKAHQFKHLQICAIPTWHISPKHISQQFVFNKLLKPQKYTFSISLVSSLKNSWICDSPLTSCNHRGQIPCNSSAALKNTQDRCTPPFNIQTGLYYSMALVPESTTRTIPSTSHIWHIESTWKYSFQHSHPLSLFMMWLWNKTIEKWRINYTHEGS